MKVLVCTDPHYDWVTAGVPRFEEVARAMDHVATDAIHKRAALVVCCGDISETSGPGMLRAIEHCVGFSNRLWQQHIHSLWLTGNHDVIEDGLRTSTMSPLRDAPGAVLADHPMMLKFGQRSEPVAFSEEGRARQAAKPPSKNLINVCALPYTPRTHSYDPAAFVEQSATEHPDVDLVFGHLMLEGIGPGSETRDMPRGRDVFWPLDALARRWPTALKVGGHYHRAEVFRGVHIVGSLCRLMQVEASNRPSYLEIDL